MQSDSPATMLDEIDRLRRLTRARAHGATFPLAVFAAMTLASTLLYRRPFALGTSFAGRISGYAGLYGFDRSAALSIMFWLGLAPLCYVGCAWWYRRRAEHIGLAMRWQSWIYTGVALMVVVVVALFARQHGIGVLAEESPVSGPQQALSPLLAVALGFLVLARVERSWGTVVVAVLYGALSVIMNAYPFGEIPSWLMPPRGGSVDWLYSPGPNLVLLASVPLVGALALQLRNSTRGRESSQA